jgi:hypothetical protein
MLATRSASDARILRPAAGRSRAVAAGWSPATALWLGSLAGLAALVLYAATGSRGVEWQDSGVHQYRILAGQLEHPFGLALSHPLHYWLGRLALLVPFGDPLHRLDLLSGVCGAVTVGVLTGLLVRLTRSAVAAIFAAGALALAHSFWQMSAQTDTYTLAAALLTIEWALLLRYVRTANPRWLMAVFAVNGLHVADHLLGLLPLATYGVLLIERLVRRRIAPVWLPVAIIVWLLGCEPYWTLVLEHWQRTGDLAATLQNALFGGGGYGKTWTGNVLNVLPSWTQAKLAIGSYGYCFPSAVVLVAVVGLLRRARGRRRLFRHVLLAQTVLILVFIGRYKIPDVYKYFVPVCVVTALWFGKGVAVLLRRWSTGAGRAWLVTALVVNALLPLAVYYYFPLLAERHNWLRSQMRAIPYRNEYLHFFRPWRFADDTAAVFAREALAAVAPDRWLLADSTTAYTVAASYLVYGGPRDIRIYCERTCLADGCRLRLTDDELLAFLRHGGQVIAVPSLTVEDMIRPPLVIERTQPFWHIQAQ